MKLILINLSTICLLGISGPPDKENTSSAGYCFLHVQYTQLEKAKIYINKTTMPFNNYVFVYLVTYNEYGARGTQKCAHCRYPTLWRQYSKY